VRFAIAARKRKAPSKENGCLPVGARRKDLLIASQSLSQRLGGVDPVAVGFEWEHVMPDGFLPASGGSILLGTSDRWAFGAIPADDFNALYRVARIGVYSANISPHGVVVWSDRGNVAFVTEFSSDALDRHLFIASLAEAAALDSRQIGGWHAVYGDYAGGTGFAGYGRRVVVIIHPVCRFYCRLPTAHISLPRQKRNAPMCTCDSRDWLRNPTTLFARGFRIWEAGLRPGSVTPIECGIPRRTTIGTPLTMMYAPGR
jgi:hypothetical protein